MLDRAAVVEVMARIEASVGRIGPAHESEMVYANDVDDDDEQSKTTSKLQMVFDS